MENQRKPICTFLLLAINVVFFLVQSSEGDVENVFYMMQRGAMYAPFVFDEGEYYRIFTSTFMHFGFEHLFNNMISLLIIGMYLEPAIGKVKFLLVYLLSGIGGSVASLWWQCQTGEYSVSAGASGAVFGLTGALLCVSLINHSYVAQLSKNRILFSIAISLYNGFVSEGVDNAAHIGGVVSGLILTFLFCRQSHAKSGACPDF